MKTIEITVSRTGDVRVETKGFAGAKCRSASHFIEQLLGVVTDEQLTKGYFQFEEAKQSQLLRHPPGPPV